ncbi:MAG: hypothetical protein HYY13_04590 [Nitrospirae bacterium]|nr:hypothetical protein [Nitrospirota bacterium]
MDLQQFLTVHRTYKSFGRLREIVTILSRHGLSQFSQATPLIGRIPGVSRWRRGAKGGLEDAPLPRRIRWAMEELGPTFVKLGQMLSMRPDLVPPDYVAEFQHLQDAVNPLPWDAVRPLLKERLGGEPHEVFAAINERPMASASIAQVHEARLRSGEVIVVKLQRPGIGPTVEEDLDILGLLAQFMVKAFPELEVLNPVGVVEEFGRTIRRELDFRIEAHNIEVIRRNFETYEGVRIPRVHTELTGERVLVMEKIEGVKVTDIEAIRRMGHDPVALARRGADIVIKQVLKDGVFHGDLHAGNILVTPKGEVGLLDFGVLGHMDKKLIRGIATIFVGLMEQEFGLIAEEIIDLCQPRSYVDITQFERDVRNAVLPYFGLELAQLNVGLVLLETFGLAFKYRLKVPQDLFLLARSLVTIESIGRTLDPKFDVLAVGSTYTKDLAAKQLDPETLRKEALVLGRTYLRVASQLPYQARAFAARAVTDGIRIEVNHPGLEGAVRRQERAVNRVALSILSATLLAGGGLLLAAGADIRFHGVPILFTVSALGAAALGAFALVGMLGPVLRR